MQTITHTYADGTRATYTLKPGSSVPLELGKIKPAKPSKIKAPKRTFPRYKAGMSTAEYVKLFESFNHTCCGISGGDGFWQPLNTEPAAGYMGIDTVETVENEDLDACGIGSDAEPALMPEPAEPVKADECPAPAAEPAAADPAPVEVSSDVAAAAVALERLTMAYSYCADRRAAIESGRRGDPAALAYLVPALRRMVESGGGLERSEARRALDDLRLARPDLVPDAVEPVEAVEAVEHACVPVVQKTGEADPGEVARVSEVCRQRAQAWHSQAGDPMPQALAEQAADLRARASQMAEAAGREESASTEHGASVAGKLRESAGVYLAAADALDAEAAAWAEAGAAAGDEMPDDGSSTPDVQKTDEPAILHATRPRLVQGVAYRLHVLADAVALVCRAADAADPAPWNPADAPDVLARLLARHGGEIEAARRVSPPVVQKTESDDNDAAGPADEQRSPPSVQKTGRLQITITRAEGLADECGKPATAESFAAADAILRAWSETAPASGGYDKCDFCITWLDGDEYHGRYDLKHHSIERPSLADHIINQCDWYAGRAQPEHMTRAGYLQRLASLDADLIAVYAATEKRLKDAGAWRDILRPVPVDLRALLASGKASLADLVGLGVRYAGHDGPGWSDADGEGAITEADDSGYGLRLAVTLEDGRVLHPGEHEFMDSLRPAAYRINWKRHGAPYMAQLSAAVAMRKASQRAAEDTRQQAMVDAESSRVITDPPAFYWNGIKDDKGAKLQRAQYSDGQVMGYPAGTLTIYARDYRHFSDKVRACFAVTNDSDYQTDYFCNDVIRVIPSHPLYAQVRAAMDAQTRHHEQTRQRRAERRGCRA